MRDFGGKNRKIRKKAVLIRAKLGQSAKLIGQCWGSQLCWGPFFRGRIV